MADSIEFQNAIRRLALSKYYLRLALDHGKLAREVDVFVSVNLLHEAAETFLVAAAAHVNASIGSKEDFAGYFDKIDKIISPQRLPFRSKLIRLNKARIMAKHDSVVPERSELPGFLTVVREFLEESSQIIFSIDFRTVSLINSLKNGKQRDLLLEAEAAFQRNEFANTLINCRKSIYLQYERNYDAKMFLSDSAGGLFAVLSKVPYYARNREYIIENVKEPTDYIVLDHQQIDNELVKNGLDTHQFWNIWRLTPRVYQAEGDRWIVRHEPDIVEAAELKENAAYVLENTVDHFVALARVRERQRVVPTSRWTVTSGISGTSLFVKASKNSEVAHKVPAGLVLNVDGATEGLEDGTMFWRITASFSETNEWFYGYALEEELDFN